MSPDLLPVLFFGVALIYSSVGLGGGSSYTALMTIFNVQYEQIPTISLALNLLVTFIAVLNFWRGGHLRWNLIWPFLVASVPTAYLGGSLALSETVFYWILLVSLVFIVFRIILSGDLKLRWRISGRGQVLISLVLGSILGFVAGTVGIGGGIYLVPLIILFGLGSEKEAAAAGAVFIWLNSLSGILARVQREAYNLEFLLPLVAAVLVGGLVGSHYGALKFKPQTLQHIIALVLMVAIVFLIRRLV